MLYGRLHIICIQNSEQTCHNPTVENHRGEKKHGILCRSSHSWRSPALWGVITPVGNPPWEQLSRVAVSPCPAMPCSPCKQPAFVQHPPFTHTQSLSIDDWATHTVPSDSQPWHHGEHSGYRVNMVSKLITHTQTTPFTTSLGVSISKKGCTVETRVYKYFYFHFVSRFGLAGWLLSVRIMGWV